MEATTAIQLKRLAKHYSALSPSNPTAIPPATLPSPEVFSLASTQDWLVQFLLNGDGTQGEDGTGGERWKKVFWKRIVLGRIEMGFNERRERGEDVEDEVSSCCRIRAAVGQWIEC